MANNISVVFNADTQQFVANTDNMSKSVARSAEAVAKAKNDIVASFKMQVAAAKEVGASHQELESIQKRSAQMIASVTEDNATRTINSLNRIAERQKAVAAELKTLQVVAPLPTGGGHEVSDRMAASATVRGLENGNPGIRSIENFLTTIPGVGKAMQAIFPLIGAAGLTGLLVEMGIAGYEAFEKVRKSAEVMHDSFAALHDKSVVFLDDKALENQKIQDQIDKLSGKPNNGLATALLEAKKMADQLVLSLQEDRKQLEALFKEHDTGAFGKALSLIGVGPESTGQQEKELLRDQKDLTKQIRAAKEEYNKALTAAPDDNAREAVTKAYNASIRKAFQSQIDSYKREDARLAKEESDSHARQALAMSYGGGKDVGGIDTNIIDNSTKRELIQGRTGQLEDMQTAELLNESIYAGNKTLGSVKQKHEDGELAAKAEAARHKAAEAQLKGFEDTLNKRKQLEQLDIADEILFWDTKLAAAAKYPENLAKVNAKLGTLQQEFYRWLDTEAKKAVEAQKKQVEETKRQDAELLSLMEKWEQQTEARANSSARLDEAQSRAKIAMREWTLTQQVATGALSRHDAAVQLAILHASDYAKQLAELDREEENDRQRSTLTDDERATRKNGRDIRRTELLSKQDITAAQDGVNIVAATWQGALRNANAAFVQDSRDTAKQVAELYQQALSGLNENLSSLMVGDKSNFAGMFRGIGKTLANDSLKKVESPILGALGLGKADGSASNPFSVKVVGGDFNSGLKDGLKGIFGGDGKDESKPSGVGGFFGSLISGLFGGHRALGGGVKAGVTYDVGEMGREEFTPSVDGTITPHNKTSGNVAYYTVNVANGVTPEQMNMHVSSALQQFHPQVVRDSVKAVTANRARNPASSRS